MAITRIIYATVKIACCRDGVEAYNPYPRQIVATQTKRRFDESVKVWQDKARQAMHNKYYHIAEEECSTMGTLSLCSFDLTIDRVIETDKPLSGIGIEEISPTFTIAPTPVSRPTPKFIQHQIQLLKERISESEDVDERMALKEELDKLKEKYNEM